MTPEEIAAMKAENEKLKKDLEEANKKKDAPPPKPDPKPDPKPEDDEDLRKKAEKDRKAKEDEAAKNKRLETAIGFNHALPKFFEENKSVLPAEVDGIIKKASEVNYDTAVDRAKAVKQAIVESYFSLKENVEPLTASHKAQLDEFLKLTKNAKEDRIENLYDNVFEPALATAKAVRKAAELAKAELGLSPDGEDKNVKRIIELGQRHYLGKKESA